MSEVAKYIHIVLRDIHIIPSNGKFQMKLTSVDNAMVI